MAGLSNAPGPPSAFGSSSLYHNWTPDLTHLLNGDDIDLDYGYPDAGRQRSSRSVKKSKRPKTRHSKRSKSKRRSYIHGYLLQVIGLVCFILAAVKSYEPLTGIGFTLVLLGYNKNTKKDRRIDLSSSMKRHKKPAHSAKTQDEDISITDDQLHNRSANSNNIVSSVDGSELERNKNKTRH